MVSELLHDEYVEELGSRALVVRTPRVKVGLFATDTDRTAIGDDMILVWRKFYVNQHVCDLILILVEFLGLQWGVCGSRC